MRIAITKNRLENICKVKTETIRLYLCRSELNHIKYLNGVYYCISEEDIERLKELTNRRKSKTNTIKGKRNAKKKI